jgi:hypothetical protein
VSTAPPTDLIDLAAFSVHVGVPVNTLWQWVARYDVPSYGVKNRRKLYSLADLYRCARLARENAKRTRGNFLPTP